jgi:hypothetical protein
VILLWEGDYVQLSYPIKLIFSFNIKVSLRIFVPNWVKLNPATTWFNPKLLAPEQTKT